MRAPKVIGVHRTDRGRFAFDLSGRWQSGKSGVILTSPAEGDNAPLELLSGYLNSELLDLWYGVRGRTPRDIWRDYEPKPMGGIPYRHVDLAGKGKGSQLKKLESALKKSDAEGAAGSAALIAADLREAGDTGLASDAPQAVEAGRALEAVVRALADNRRALLPYRDRFPQLTRVVKDPWSTEAVDPVPDAFVAAMPVRKRASVRVDPELTCSIDTDGALGRGTLDGDALVFTYRRQPVARVEGPRGKLMLLGELVALAAKRTMPEELLATEVPRDIEDFQAAVEGAAAEVKSLIASGRVLVEAAERLVCALYAIPADLEEEVVAHAAARAVDRHAR
jgi:hypothetical protein